MRFTGGQSDSYRIFDCIPYLARPSMRTYSTNCNRGRFEHAILREKKLNRCRARDDIQSRHATVLRGRQLQATLCCNGACLDHFCTSWILHSWQGIRSRLDDGSLAARVSLRYHKGLRDPHARGSSLTRLKNSRSCLLREAALSLT